MLKTNEKLFSSLKVCLQLHLQVWSIFSFYKTGFILYTKYFADQVV